MAVVVASGLSTPGAYVKTVNLVSGTYEFIGKGKITLVVKGSVAGINANLIVGGLTLIPDTPVMWYGNAGTLSVNDNIMCSQMVTGGRIELYLRNITATAGTTCDYMVLFDSM